MAGEGAAVLRMMLVNFVLVGVAAAAGMAILHAGGVDPHPRELLLAASVALLASCVGAMPVALGRGRAGDMGALFQACFLGTVLHLATALALAAMVLLALRPGAGFVYWMLVMYWLTLGGLCGAMVRAMRRPMQTPASLSR